MNTCAWSEKRPRRSAIRGVIREFVLLPIRENQTRLGVTRDRIEQHSPFVLGGWTLARRV